MNRDDVPVTHAVAELLCEFDALAHCDVVSDGNSLAVSRTVTDIRILGVNVLETLCDRDDVTLALCVKATVCKTTGVGENDTVTESDRAAVSLADDDSDVLCVTVPLGFGVTLIQTDGVCFGERLADTVCDAVKLTDGDSDAVCVELIESLRDALTVALRL